MTELFANSELIDLISKVRAGERLNSSDGVRLFNSNDLLAIGYMADLVRKQKHGTRVYFLQEPYEESLSGNEATVLYGRNMSCEQKVERLIGIRDEQDRSGNYVAFVPKVEDDGHLTGFDDIKMLSVARLLLDNVEHITALWMQIGPKLAQVALNFGVDDLAGPGICETSTQNRGAEHAQGMTVEGLTKMITAAGFQAVERDNLYRAVGK